MIYLSLFWEFFKIGLFCFGGAFGMIPLIEETVLKYEWLTESEFYNFIGVCESTPGPIGVNMATYCGYNAGFETGGIALGIVGGIVATLSLVLPSVIIIIIVARMLDKFKNSTLVDNAFKGLRPAGCGMIASAALSVFAGACLNTEAFSLDKNLFDFVDLKAIVVFAILFVANKKFKPHPIFIIIPAAVLGMVFKF